MLIVCDTNILSSFAAGNALHLLYQLFPKATINIPPAVHSELQTGLAYGQKYLQEVLKIIDGKKLPIVNLSKLEQQLARSLPKKLNVGECEAMALSENRKGLLLTNDKRAVRYCKEHNIKVLDLPLLFRLLWTKNIVSQNEVKTLLRKMKDVENLQLSPNAFATVFAPK